MQFWFFLPYVKQGIGERVPENEERDRNAFLIFRKGTRQERNQKNQEERERNARVPQASFFNPFALKL